MPGTGEAQAQGKEAVGLTFLGGGVGRRSEAKLSMLQEYLQFHIKYIWGDDEVGGGRGERERNTILNYICVCWQYTSLIPRSALG